MKGTTDATEKQIDDLTAQNRAKQYSSQTDLVFFQKFFKTVANPLNDKKKKGQYWICWLGDPQPIHHKLYKIKSPGSLSLKTVTTCLENM